MTVRPAASALTVLAATGAMLAVPVLARPVAEAHAVAPHIAAINVAPTPATRGLLGETTQPRTHTFNLVGATWHRGSLDAGASSLEVRVHSGDTWSGWRALAPTDGGADGGTADARRAATVKHETTVAEPLYVGHADGVQARVVGTGQVPADLHVLLVDGGTSSADANPNPVRVWGGDVANAEQDQPTIYTRADWGADESLRRQACPNGPEYSPTIKMGFLHHTDSGNGYSQGAVPGIIRSIYAYHVRANGWCDVGYNYLVDRFGRIWEGRYGGIDKNVLGAHTGGFNYDSFGVSMIGTFTSSPPDAAMTSAVEQIFAWRLGGYYLDPKGTSTMTADAFSGSRYRAGSSVTLKTVSGHRDADTTTCPGSAAYARLPDIRTGVIAAMGAGFVAPRVNATSAQMANGSFTVNAGAITSQTWTLTVTNATGVPIQTVTGSATRTSPVSAVWNLTDSTGAPVLPGDYTLTLSAADTSGDAALPWSTTVTVTPPFTMSVLPQTSLNTGVWPIG
ncbi:MAG TPA: N-acetylmuramoyl-L-alanine amidase, partial [Mycobacteriales bacterium]|nr:N-acetylmuramoyl-L-alanine amidase [Mycobacteriales bacterium]